MWLFAKHGFFSIVMDRDNPDYLLVRARIKGDIENYWPDAEIKFTPENDYAYRASIPVNDVAMVLCQMVFDIDYDNYKANIYDQHRRSYRYADVWQTMALLQDENLREADDESDPHRPRKASC